MNKILGIIVVLVVLGGLAWFLQGSGSQSAMTQGPIKIGVIAPLTGDGAIYGEPMRNVLQVAADEVNAAGGVNNEQIQLIVDNPNIFRCYFVKRC